MPSQEFIEVTVAVNRLRLLAKTLKVIEGKKSWITYADKVRRKRIDRYIAHLLGAAQFLEDAPDKAKDGNVNFAVKLYKETAQKYDWPPIHENESFDEFEKELKRYLEEKGE